MSFIQMFKDHPWESIGAGAVIAAIYKMGPIIINAFAPLTFGP